MVKRILVIEQAPFEHLGYLKELIEGASFDIRYCRPYNGDEVPRSTEGFNALIVLGGHMSATGADDGEHPYLLDEIALLKEGLGRNLPILGICLGAQLLARAAGAKVYEGHGDLEIGPEVGWYTVDLTPEAERDPLFYNLGHNLGVEEGPDGSLEVLQWHSDTFDIPDGGVRLAGSEMYPNQLFRLGECAYGIQFHLEVTEGMIPVWIKETGALFKRHEGVLDPVAILEDTTDKIEGLKSNGFVVFSRFFKMVHEMVNN